MFDIKDKVAIVTGATSGIGLAAAKAIADKGGKVALCDISEERGQQALKEFAPGSAAFMKCDVSKEDQVKALVQFAVDKFGALDIMVCNAGVANKLCLGSEADPEEYMRVFAVNQFGVMLCMKHATAQMVKQGTPGSIVCLASVEAFIASAYLLPYVATKGAVNQMVKAEALAQAKRGIRVAAVAPGGVITNMLNEGAIGEKFFEQTIAKHPIGRLAQPEEIAHAIVFCIENEFVTGSTVLVDGGFTAQ